MMEVASPCKLSSCLPSRWTKRRRKKPWPSTLESVESMRPDDHRAINTTPRWNGDAQAVR